MYPNNYRSPKPNVKVALIHLTVGLVTSFVTWSLEELLLGPVEENTTDAQ